MFLVPSAPVPARSCSRLYEPSRLFWQEGGNRFFSKLHYLLLPSRPADLPQLILFGIKPFASNSLFKGSSALDHPNAEEDSRRARLAIRNILSNPAVTAPIPGLINLAQVDNEAQAVLERRQLDQAEKAELDQAAREMWARLPEDYQWLKDWEYVWTVLIAEGVAASKHSASQLPISRRSGPGRIAKAGLALILLTPLLHSPLLLGQGCATISATSRPSDNLPAAPQVPMADNRRCFACHANYDYFDEPAS